MLIEKMHFYIALLAGAVMTAVNIYLGASLVDTCVRLIITLVIFYPAGYAVKVYVHKKILHHPELDMPLLLEEDEDIINAEPTLMADETPMDDLFTPDDGFLPNIDPPIEDEAP